jgi:hypothetical protein
MLKNVAKVKEAMLKKLEITATDRIIIFTNNIWDLDQYINAKIGYILSF